MTMLYYYSLSTSITTSIQDAVLFSWYDIALRLRLPELIEQHRKDDSVLINLVSALIKESSIRNRRPEEVTVSGLAVLPKPVLPLVVDNRPISPQSALPSPKAPPINTKLDSNNMPINNTPKKETSKPLILRRIVEHNNSHKNNKASAENWVPDELRRRSIERDIHTSKAILADTMLLETALNREFKRLSVTDLERAQMELKLEATRKIPCGCCTQTFLYINLPMKVSRKAILDIRIKWSGQLSSSNIFRANTFRELLDPNIEAPVQTGKRPKSGYKMDRPLSANGNHSSYDTVPRCYDEVRVCVFCAQFFQEPDEYRPSYAQITYQERKTAYLEKKQKEREYWDPLKMIEVDRKRLEESQEVTIVNAESTTNNSNHYTS
jgi:hypothetical protein